MDDWAFDQLQPWLSARQSMPVGPLFCVINGRTRGRAWSATAARAALVGYADLRCTPTAYPETAQIRALTTCERDPRAGLPYHPHIRHRNLGVTSIYLQGIDPDEIIQTSTPGERP